MGHCGPFCECGTASHLPLVPLGFQKLLAPAAHCKREPGRGGRALGQGSGMECVGPLIALVSEVSGGQLRCV